jgi:hypothetical protein
MTGWEPKYPHITVLLVGEDGNIFAIVGRARVIARRAGLAAEDITWFTEEVTSSNSYDEALSVVMKWFDTT